MSPTTLASRFAVIFLLFLTFLTLGLNCYGQEPKVLAPHKPVPPAMTKLAPYPKPAALRSMVGGLWMTDANMKSAIYLKNSLVTSKLTVTPILYLGNGTKIPLAPVTLDPSGTAIVSINDSLVSNGIAPFAQLSGYVEVQYVWPWDPICVTVRNIDVTHSLLFNYRLSTAPTVDLNSSLAAAASPPKSQILQGMWWKETAEETGFVALSNPTANAQEATVTVSDNSSVVIGQHAVTVSPNGTKMVSLDELATTAGTSGGLSVSYQGPPKAIMVSAGLEDLATGYSVNVPFAEAHPASDSAPATRSLAQLGLMTGAADAMMRFPADTVFTPYSVMRNTSSQPIPVTPTLYWMQGGASQSAKLATFTLLPQQTTRLALNAMLAGAGLGNYNGTFNLILDVPTNSVGSLIVDAGSVDQKKTYVFGVQTSAVLEGRGKALSYWSTGAGDDTMVTLWNPADEDQDFVFTLFFTGGRYLVPMHLGARATRAFNISEIVGNQTPDQEGTVIPVGVHEGSAEVEGSLGRGQHILVAIDAGTYNVQKATCGRYCVDCNGFVSGFILSDPFQLFPDTTTQETFTGQNYNGTQTNLTSLARWSSTNTAVATVSKGLVTPVTIGVFDVNSSYSDIEYDPNLCAGYALECPEVTISGSAPGTVDPTITSVSPSRGLIGATTQKVTIIGKGLSGGHINTPAAIQVSNITTATDTEIVFDAVISTTASAGNNAGAIYVTVSGQDSNKVDFYVQVPTSLSFVAGTAGGTAEKICTLNVSCGTVVSFKYQVMDQDMPQAQPIMAVMSLWDFFAPTYSPDILMLQGTQPTTTCSAFQETNSGPCGVFTNADGTFAEGILGACSSVCYKNAACTTGGPSGIQQTWEIAGYAIAQSISEYCQQVNVNGTQIK